MLMFIGDNIALKFIIILIIFLGSLTNRTGEITQQLKALPALAPFSLYVAVCQAVPMHFFLRRLLTDLLIPKKIDF